MSLSLQQLVSGVRSSKTTEYTLGVVDKLTRDEIWIDTFIHLIRQDVQEGLILFERKCSAWGLGN